MNAAERGRSIVRAIEETATGEMSIEGGLLLASNLLPSGKWKNSVAWASVGYTAGRRLWKIYKGRQKGTQYYSIKIDESDDLYDEVCSWFMEQIPEREQFAVEAETQYVRSSDKKTEDEIEDEWIDSLLRANRGMPTAKKQEKFHYEIQLSYNEKRSKPLFVDGHEIRIQHVIPGFNSEDNEDDSVDPYGDSEESRRRRQYNNSSSRYVVINCPTYEARAAVLRKLDSTLKQPAFEERQPSFYAASSWGEFKSNRDIPLRSLDSVILKPGQIETITADIERFLGAEDRYNALGMPYHRGILLHGSPGTGKTSIAAAIANHFKMDVYYISLSSVKDNTTLSQLLGMVKSRSVLLLEEIDTCAATRDVGRDKDPGTGITMDVLLQALDGMTAPHGMITIMTTNRLHVLDEAMIRAGRADLKVEITPVDTKQVEGICRHFIGYVPENLPEIEVEYGITPADIIEVFKQNIYDNEQAGIDLVEYLNERADVAIKEEAEIGRF